MQQCTVHTAPCAAQGELACACLPFGLHYAAECKATLTNLVIAGSFFVCYAALLVVLGRLASLASSARLWPVCELCECLVIG